MKPSPEQREAAARVLGVCERSLRDWQRALSKPGRLEGRPPHSREAHFRCALAVARVLKTAGLRIGEAEMLQELERQGKQHPLRLVRWALQGLKARGKARQKKLREKLRVQVLPVGPGVLWSLDATSLGRQAVGGKLEGQLVIDIADADVCAASLGPPPKAEDAIMILEQAKKERGELPLALSIDNGYDSKALRDFLEKEGVLLLVNLPYTPEHNAWVERAMRSLKEGMRWRLDLAQLRGERALELRALMLVMAEVLREMSERARARRLVRESQESTNDRDSASMPRYDRELRSQLAKRHVLRLDQIHAEGCSARQRRLLERYALLETLLEAGLINLTRGGEPWELGALEELT